MKFCMIPLVGDNWVVNFIEMESRRVVSRDWRKVRKGELVFKGYRVSVGKNENYREGHDDSYTTVGMYLMPLNCILKKVKMIFFGHLVYVFYHNKNMTTKNK